MRKRRCGWGEEQLRRIEPASTSSLGGRDCDWERSGGWACRAFIMLVDAGRVPCVVVAARLIWSSISIYSSMEWASRVGDASRARLRRVGDGAVWEMAERKVVGASRRRLEYRPLARVPGHQRPPLVPAATREYLPRWRRGACEDGKISSSTTAGVVSSWWRRTARWFK
jgi:hypothetical protein